MRLPLFPLPETVVFPGVLLPLHIFEERYRTMISECVDGDNPFGILLLKTSDEGETEENLARVGTAVRVVDVDKFEDGRMNIVCQSEFRFKVQRFRRDRPYWSGEVVIVDDDDQDRTDSEIQARWSIAGDLFRKALELGRSLAGEPQEETVLPESATALSFAISYALDLAVADKQELLELVSTSQRLDRVLPTLETTVRDLEKQVAQKKVQNQVRGNGRLRHPEDL